MAYSATCITCATPRPHCPGLTLFLMPPGFDSKALKRPEFRRLALKCFFCGMDGSQYWKTDRAGTYETRNFSLSTIRGHGRTGLGGGRLWLGSRRMAFPVLKRYRSKEFDQNSLGKRWSRICGSTVNGQQGVFFSSLRNFGKGGLGRLEPANHGTRPRANLEGGDSYHTHTYRLKTGNASSLFPFHHLLHDVGARGAKELGGSCPGNNSQDEAEHYYMSPTHPHTHTHPHHDDTTNMHNTQAGLLFR